MRATTPSDDRRDGPTVFIVDDDASCLANLITIIESEGWVVRAFDSSSGLRRAFDASWQGCVLLDLHTVEAEGPELQRWLVERSSALPVVLLARDAEMVNVESLRTGAVWVLDKPVQRGVLIAAVRAALAKAEPAGVPTEQATRSHSSIDNLTAREREICDFLLEGLNSKQIASLLSVSTRTVEHHRANILRKAGAANVVELVRKLIVAREARARREAR